MDFFKGYEKKITKSLRGQIYNRFFIQTKDKKHRKGKDTKKLLQRKDTKRYKDTGKGKDTKKLVSFVSLEGIIQRYYGKI